MRPRMGLFPKKKKKNRAEFLRGNRRAKCGSKFKGEIGGRNAVYKVYQKSDKVHQIFECDQGY